MSRWSECGLKKQHKSRGAAEAHIRGLVKAGRAKAGDLNSYACLYCGTWHVGNLREGAHRNKYRRSA
jgi:hypothetical protein